MRREEGAECRGERGKGEEEEGERGGNGGEGSSERWRVMVASDGG